MAGSETYRALASACRAWGQQPRWALFPPVCSMTRSQAIVLIRAKNIKRDSLKDLVTKSKSLSCTHHSVSGRGRGGDRFRHFSRVRKRSGSNGAVERASADEHDCHHGKDVHPSGVHGSWIPRRQTWSDETNTDRNV